MSRGGVEIKKPEQLMLMRKAGLAVARTLSALREHAQPGVTTQELDALAREHIAAAGGVSSFLHYGQAWGYSPFPAVTCISVNDEVVHGIPGDRVLQAGDLVSIDFGMSIDGWHGDSAITLGIGEISAQKAALSDVTRESLWRGIAAARLAGRVGDISAAVQGYIDAQPHAYGILTDYTGHGIGSQMHQPPDVPNYGRRGRGQLIVPGLCLAIEPMVTYGSPQTAVRDDDWTVVTRDGSAAAHWEHTVTVTRHGVWVLTAEDGGMAELERLGVPFGPLAD